MSVDQVLEFYRRLPEIYAEDDRWLALSHRWIAKFVRWELAPAGDTLPLSWLNLGSGGFTYGISERSTVHVDIHPERLLRVNTAVVADIQRPLPFAQVFAACLCVGSVLNHCDAAAVISSLAASLKTGGQLIIEFETSRSLE
jgi:SAM-dependent methyltransferase